MNRIQNSSFLLAGLLALCLPLPAFTQTKPTLAQRLGYPADAKLLLIHADDLGAAYSVNQASFKALDLGAVNSASIMVPCPWLTEVAEYSRSNPGRDLGLHLTLTSEWSLYKWSPVASRDQVSSLVDSSSGYFYDNCDDMAVHARPEEIERELRGQIERALRMGIRPTHFDTHMGCLYWTNLDLFKIYLKLGREYKVPLRLGRNLVEGMPEAFRQQLTDQDIILDHIYSATPTDFKQGMAAFYEKVLHDLKPGVNEIVIHLAYENAEMHGVAANHPDWGAGWRQADFDFFNSESCRKIMQDEKIQTVTFREIGKLLAP